MLDFQKERKSKFIRLKFQKDDKKKFLLKYLLLIATIIFISK